MLRRAVVWVGRGYGHCCAFLRVCCDRDCGHGCDCSFYAGGDGRGRGDDGDGDDGLGSENGSVCESESVNGRCPLDDGNRESRRCLRGPLEPWTFVITVVIGNG